MTPTGPADAFLRPGGTARWCRYVSSRTGAAARPGWNLSAGPLRPAPADEASDDPNGNIGRVGEFLAAGRGAEAAGWVSWAVMTGGCAGQHPGERHRARRLAPAKKRAAGGAQAGLW
jgi:hypothetical protein